MRNQSHFAVLRILVAISALLAIRSVFKRSIISISENYSLDKCYTLPTESVGTLYYTIVPLKMRAVGKTGADLPAGHAGHSLPHIHILGQINTKKKGQDKRRRHAGDGYKKLST